MEKSMLNLNGSVIYEVFPRNHGPEGTIQDIIDDLPRIKNLGTDILWLMPFYPIGEKGKKGKLGSPYAIKDYLNVDDKLGSETLFCQLITKAHDMGIKVMIDIVFNHTSKDACLLKEHPEWYYKDKGQISQKIDDWSDVYDLNFNNKGVWDYLIEVLIKWVKLGVDGFRCDVAPLIPLSFWRRAKKRVNNNKPVIWLAESVEKSFVKYLREQGFICHSDPELHQVFDLTYDYDGMEYLKSYFRGEGSLTEYINHLYVQETLYPAGALKMRFLENHDNPRVASIIGDTDRLKNWSLFYALLPGATLVYAGQEYRIKRTPSLFNKDSVPWSSGDKDFSSYFKEVLKISKVIKNNSVNWNIEEISQGILKVTWKGKNKEYLALLNLEDRYGEVNLGKEFKGRDLLSKENKSLGPVFTIDKEPILLEIKDY